MLSASAEQCPRDRTQHRGSDDDVDEARFPLEQDEVDLDALSIDDREPEQEHADDARDDEAHGRHLAGPRRSSLVHRLTPPSAQPGERYPAASSRWRDTRRNTLSRT